MSGRVLVFPAGLSQALAFAASYRASGGAVIGSSSLARDPAEDSYEQWVRLPFAHEQGFAVALTDAIITHRIDEVFVPHPVAWHVVRDVVGRGELAHVRLLNDDPVSAVSTTYRRVLDLAADYAEEIPFAIPGKRPPRLTTLQRAALFHAAENVPGMCSIEKQFVLSEIARYVPPGDLVEIGSWWGKSAFVLMTLAERFRLGNLLCVDPWSVEHLDQAGGEGLLDAVGQELDCDEAFQIFTINLAGAAAGRVNYLRRPSIAGAERYRSFPGAVETPEFGRTAYTGAIALLHIDGNHADEAASADVRAWAPLVRPGGWLVLDDYCWTYGEGPRKAADGFLQSSLASFDRAFVAAGTLFARRSPSLGER